MRVIMLKGPRSYGKTTTLNIVYAELLLAGATITRGREQVGERPNSMDFEVELSCTRKGKTKQVAIFSAGDVLREVKDAIAKYAEIGSDVLIIAFRTDFVSVPYEPDQYPGSPPPVEKKSYPPATRTLEDIQTAREIIALI